MVKKMNVRAQLSMVFHLDKCIGCHTCSIACKNIWTDRPGAEYMWWNNVETKPGTGYPTAWEDQEKYRGGWRRDESGKISLRSTGKARGFANLFHQPAMPTMDDYYEPFTYRYSDLFNAPAGDDQPVARPVSMVTGEPMEIKSGPNWDDDLSGSPIYAANDPNFSSLTPEQKKSLFEIERMVFFYVPRMCNHCVNPACVAACPSGALHKRGEDGIVLVNQEMCRGWRHCVPACPYKKVYYNWQTGKSEKCILCFPRVETGQAPACFHSCVGRIRYLGMVLYDADRIETAVQAPDRDLVDRHRELILDPNDPQVIEAARASGVSDGVIAAAAKSPVYKFVKEWGLALPLHAEHRTLPMLFYVPPLLPVIGKAETGIFGTLDDARVPIEYLAKLFAAGNTALVEQSLRRLMAVRLLRRSQTVGDIEEGVVNAALSKAGLTRVQAEAVYKLTTLATFEERFVVPPSHREQAVELLREPELEKRETGFGPRQEPRRGP